MIKRMIYNAKDGTYRWEDSDISIPNVCDIYKSSPLPSISKKPTKLVIDLRRDYDTV